MTREPLSAAEAAAVLADEIAGERIGGLVTVKVESDGLPVLSVAGNIAPSGFGWGPSDADDPGVIVTYDVTTDDGLRVASFVVHERMSAEVVEHLPFQSVRLRDGNMTLTVTYQ